MSSVKTGTSGTPQNSAKSRKRSYATIIEQQLEETAQLLRADSHQEESEEDAFGRSIAKASSRFKVSVITDGLGSEEPQRSVQAQSSAWNLAGARGHRVPVHVDAVIVVWRTGAHPEFCLQQQRLRWPLLIVCGFTLYDCIHFVFQVASMEST